MHANRYIRCSYAKDKKLIQLAILFSSMLKVRVVVVCLNIRRISESLGDFLCSLALFLHGGRQI